MRQQLSFQVFGDARAPLQQLDHHVLVRLCAHVRRQLQAARSAAG